MGEGCDVMKPKTVKKTFLIFFSVSCHHFLVVHYTLKCCCGLSVLPRRDPWLSDSHSLFLPSSSPMTTRLLPWQRLLTCRNLPLFIAAWMPNTNRPQHRLEALSTAKCHNRTVFDCSSADNQQTNNPL